MDYFRDCTSSHLHSIGVLGSWDSQSQRPRSCRVSRLWVDSSSSSQYLGTLRRKGCSQNHPCSNCLGNSHLPFPSVFGVPISFWQAALLRSLRPGGAVAGECAPGVLTYLCLLTFFLTLIKLSLRETYPTQLKSM